MSETTAKPMAEASTRLGRKSSNVQGNRPLPAKGEKE